MILSQMGLFFSQRDLSHILKFDKDYDLLKKNNGVTDAFVKKLNNIKPVFNTLKSLFLYYDMRTSLPDDLLMYTDKVTMNFGLECRVPILDNDLIEFVESLHSCYKFNLKRNKIIHKEFAKEYLPIALVERKKLDFQSPTAEWFRVHINEIENLFFNNAE